MKKCTSCDKEIKEQAQFCPFCGSSQQETTKPVETTFGIESFEETSDRTNQATETETKEERSSSMIDSEAVDALTEKGKHYLTYLNRNITGPKIGADNEHGYFGLINYVLISVFTGLAVSHSLGKILSLKLDSSSFPLLIQLILCLLSIQIVYVGVVFIGSKKMYQSDMSFVDTFDKIYGPVSIGVYFSLAAFILSFLFTTGVGILYIITLITPFILVNVSYVGNLWVVKDPTNEKNRFYITLVLLVSGAILQGIVSLIFVDMIGSSVVSMLTNTVDNLLNGLVY